MKFSRFAYCIKKAYALGAVRIIGVIKNRCQLKLFDLYWRKAAQYNRAHWSWASIARNHTVTTSFAEFFNHKKGTPSSIAHHIFAVSGYTPAALNQLAFSYQHQIFEMLGSEKQSYVSIPWHCDFRLHNHQKNMNHSATCYFDPSSYYKDIYITAGQSQEQTKDIKMPWELSRLQHLLVLAQAYRLSGELSLRETFVNQWHDWFFNNPFLKGAAWVCPMDVGIRAVNLVLCAELLKGDSSITEEFWQQYSCCLYDHLFYLEHNWEYYDSRTSNHYLSDLIGYLYLCSYFITLPGIEQKFQWCSQELLREFEKQVFDEGTDYEGSTCYHRLVTEIFYHWYLVCLEHDNALAVSVYTKLQKMFEFLAWCMPNESTLLQIGDNDSGKITYAAISWSLIESMKEASNTRAHKKIYADFGLVLYKDNQWHGSLRSYSYHTVQPSGHFHNDANSITLYYDGQPLIVDPGSYIYTPSAYWRNAFRSVAAHSTFYKCDEEPIPFDEKLFTLDMPACRSEISSHEDTERQLYSYHDLYKGVRAHRLVEYTDTSVIIYDWWTATTSHTPSTIPTVWNFCLHNCVVLMGQDTMITLTVGEKKFILYSQQLDYQCVPGWISSEYGVKKTTYYVRAQKNVGVSEKIITLLRLMD